jgi:hypothetical protein
MFTLTFAHVQADALPPGDINPGLTSLFSSFMSFAAVLTSSKVCAALPGGTLMPNLLINSAPCTAQAGCDV